MFFLGGMTMGYLAPPAKVDSAAASVSVPAEKDRRKIDVSNASQQPNAVERSLIWAWRTVC
ncbi:hypothetical protein FZ934_16130 [Rhizobium grahamii]|uniref:Uncharacterized protein n=1 Tax=Rhizobium grahamii TaxID=1120045 RepID=A0A5Q0CD10_9HYPH|nr:MULTISPECIES: hypothetical protein [Rhizobium]QFY61791.1 hypothetical protein FZ934_16130 [Rhizobium grahamii]QRM49039.1 hypothetical protein F3Y33_06765 [Rhizobium sp. BG6]